MRLARVRHGERLLQRGVIAAVGPRGRPSLKAEPLLDAARPAESGRGVVHDDDGQLAQAGPAGARDRLVVGALIELAVTEKDEAPRAARARGPQAEGGADGQRQPVTERAAGDL